MTIKTNKILPLDFHAISKSMHLDGNDYQPVNHTICETDDDQIQITIPTDYLCLDSLKLKVCDTSIILDGKIKLPLYLFNISSTKCISSNFSYTIPIPINHSPCSAYSRITSSAIVIFIKKQ